MFQPLIINSHKSFDEKRQTRFDDLEYKKFFMEKNKKIGLVIGVAQDSFTVLYCLTNA